MAAHARNAEPNEPNAELASSLRPMHPAVEAMLLENHREFLRS